MAELGQEPTSSNVKPVALDWDIITSITDYVEKKRDILAVMHTCRMFYSAGIQPLVRSSPCLNASNIESFHTFMLSHSPVSFNALDSLSLNFLSGCSRTEETLVVDLLTRGGDRLKRLCWGCSGSGSNGPVWQAITTLKGLRQLHVDNQTEDSSDAVDLLSRLQSPLSDLKVNFWADYEAPVSLLLTAFSQTLESLTLECQAFVSSDVCFSRLTTLKVQMATLPQLPSLMTACPNLQELDIVIKGSYPEDVGPLRSQNIAFQQANAATLWTSLRCVTAQSLFLYAMGLRQEIETLTITDRLYTSIGCRGPDEALYNLQCVLWAARPRELTLRHTFSDLNDFRRIWRAVSRILYIVNLTLEFHPLTRDPQRTLITISKALQILDNSSVQKLTLRFYLDREHETHSSRKPDIEFYERWVKEKLSRPCDVRAEIRDDMVVF